MINRNLVCGLAIIFFLSACESSGPKQTGGTLLGAGLGALAGAQFGSGSGQVVAGVAGAVLGAWLGGEIGKSMDEDDKRAAQNTTVAALENNPTGTSSSWSNPDNGNSGSVTPTSDYKVVNGQDCREFETTIKVDGREEKAYGNACRDADGNWRVRE